MRTRMAQMLLFHSLYLELPQDHSNLFMIHFFLNSENKEAQNQRQVLIIIHLILIRSDQISSSVVSDSLQPHESQHARPPCPSPTPRVHWDSRPSSQWCNPAISSSAVPFSSCPQSLPSAESFPMSQLFAWGGPSTGVSASVSASVSFPPKNDGLILLQNGLDGSPCSPGDSQESSPTPQFKSINSSALSFLHSPTLTSIHDH